MNRYKFLIVFLLCSCGSPPKNNFIQLPPRKPLDLNNASYGAYPYNYEAIIKDWIFENLKDPESTRYRRISKPRKEYMFEYDPFYGYSVCATINSKNSYGAYTGYKTYWFMIRDGKIARFYDTDAPRDIAGVIPIPGNLISADHFVNCNDGDKDGN
jgi:hypothetical protein